LAGLALRHASTDFMGCHDFSGSWLWVLF
jgi:hypothetical protein